MLLFGAPGVGKTHQAIGLGRAAVEAGHSVLFVSATAHLFFQLVARRYERGSMLITTNQLVSQWGTVFGDDVLAAAILDRLLHQQPRVDHPEARSYRLRQKRKAAAAFAFDTTCCFRRNSSGVRYPRLECGRTAL